jgi:hypothetical protein
MSMPRLRCFSEKLRQVAASFAEEAAAAATAAAAAI